MLSAIGDTASGSDAIALRTPRRSVKGARDAARERYGKFPKLNKGLQYIGAQHSKRGKERERKKKNEGGNPEGEKAETAPCSKR
jgi:hypothetical protein